MRTYTQSQTRTYLVQFQQLTNGLPDRTPGETVRIQARDATQVQAKLRNQYPHRKVYGILGTVEELEQNGRRT